VQDEAIYRCINPACARAMPRRVNFCPYCGTAQVAGMPAPAPAAAPVAGDAHVDRAAAAAVAAAAGAQAAAGLAGWSDAPDDAAVPPAPDRAAAPSAAALQTASGPAGPASKAPAAASGASATSAPAAPGPAAPASAAPSRSDAPSAPTPAGEATAAAPSAHAFGRSGRPADAGAAPTGAPGRGRGIPWSPQPAAPSTPQGRRPIRLRWWIIALVVLWGVWLWAKPSTKKIDRRIDAAIALAQACQGKQAQDELIALRATRATPKQLERLQRALNEASSACTRKRQRAKAWDDARGPIVTALAARNPERARTRLAAFTKRWGEDDDTRAIEARIEALKREHPLAVPEAGDGMEAPPPRY